MTDPISNNSNGEKFRIAIKDIAKLMRMSTEAIRYYEKRKILTPYRDEENSYRFYEESDILKIIGCRHYQELGFTIAEVVDLLNGYKGGSFDEMLEAKREEIAQRILEQQQSLVRIDESLESSRDFEKNFGKYYIVESLHCMAMFYAVDSVFQHDRIQHPYWDAVSKNLNYFIYLAKISPEALGCTETGSASGADNPQASGPLIMNEGFSVRYEMGRSFGLEPDGMIEELLPQRCVYTVCKARPVISAEQLTPVLEWIRSKNFKIAGDILCRARGLSYENGEVCRYYDINVPVED